MKTTVKKMDYDQVMALPRGRHWTPKKPNFFWRSLVRAISGLGMGGCKLDATIEGCDYTVKIPMSHDVDSLNVAAASAVAFWELRYQI